jgi:hypothetical protein
MQVDHVANWVITLPTSKVKWGTDFLFIPYPIGWVWVWTWVLDGKCNVYMPA